MKDITRISLVQLPYNIEIAAKKDLEKYLHEIEAALKADEDAMKEIEARIVELLAERGVEGERVITADDVATIQQQLGSPRDFADDEDEASEELAQLKATNSIVTKRFMRDPSSALLGGVCSGMAAYLKLDPVWVRLIFIVVVFATSGLALLLYVVAWLIVPPARTAAERLQMRGQTVTLEALQAESAMPVRDNRARNLVATALRYTIGIALLLAAFGGMVGLIASIWTVTYHYESAPGIAEISTSMLGSMSLAGLLFVLFCVLAGAAFLRGKLTKGMLVAVVVTVVLGIGAFVVGVAAAVLEKGDQLDIVKHAGVERELDVSTLGGIKQIWVDTKSMDVYYHATHEKPRATLVYNRLSHTDAPIPDFVRDNDTLRIAASEAETTGKSVWLSDSRPKLHLYGSELDKITTVSGHSYYESKQQALAVEVAQAGALEFISGAAVTDLTVSARDSGSLSLQSGIISRVRGELATTGHVAFATVSLANLKIRDACPGVDEPISTYHFDHVGRLTVNDQPYDKNATYPCADIQVERDE